MRDRCDEDVISANSIEQNERIPRKHVAPLSTALLRPAVWRFSHRANRGIELEQKTLSCYLASLSIPSFLLGDLLIRFRMKPDAFHPRLKSLALTSSQGIV